MSTNNYKKQTRLRIITLEILFIIAFSIVTIRLFDISVLGHMLMRDHRIQAIEHADAFRPIIVDKNGIKLAVNLQMASLYTNPHKIINKEEIANKLHNILLDIPYEILYKKLSTTNSSFIWIKRHLTPNEQYLVNNLGIPHLKFKNEQKRIYTHSNAFSHLLGYVDIDGNGLSGLERYLDQKKLQGNIALSVDTRVQNIVHEELKQTVKYYQALGAAGIVLDARTSEILAMVSLPDFDPHHLKTLSDTQKFNRAILGLYEFGSIMKPFTMAAALDASIINLDTEYDVSQPLHLGKYIIKDFHKHPTAILDVERIFSRSSNIGMAKIGMQLGDELQKKYLNAMGFFSPLAIEIPEKSMPILPKRWSNITTTTLSYGYGASFTLLHLTQAMAAIVNDGKFYPATLFAQTKNYQQVITQETSASIRDLMCAVIQKGTGRRANAKGYNVGGKTGSAEKSINGVYVKSINVSSFIAVFPIEEPQYIIAIMIDEPKPMESKFVTGGIVAAPTVKNIINRIAPILNILPR